MIDVIMEKQLSDFEALQKSVHEKEELEIALEKKMDRWAELTEKLETIQIQKTAGKQKGILK